MSEAADTSEQQDLKHEESPKKRVRHRKKLLYENIRKQMEFYFSDANISKDRFLGDLIKKSPFVPVEMFLKFNKIRSMTQDVVDIIKALKHSTILELSDDRTKVQRKSPFLPYDADSRTVYVESIPVTANRDWLQGVFRDYGKVSYISLPKFKNTDRIKGYAFIEYDKPEEAQKCISAFTKMGCKLPTNMAPEHLSTIRMFSIDEPPEELGKKIDKEDYEPPKKKTKKGREKKKSVDKMEEHDTDTEKKNDTTLEESKTTDAEESKGDTSHDEMKLNSTPEKKKIRKRSAKERSKSRKNNEAPKEALWGLQVLPKSEWKILRNRYLNLQWKNMKELKRNLRNGYAYKTIPEPSLEMKPGMPESMKVDCKKEVVPLEQIPGVFVKTELLEPCEDIRSTKRQFRTNVHCLHVEVKEGQKEVILRFDSNEAASEYCKTTDNRGKVLSGSEEDEQWSRAQTARVQASNPSKRRGRSRLMEKAQTAIVADRRPASPQPTHTHIRFEDE